MIIACNREKVERLVQLLVDMMDDRFFLTDNHPYLEKTRVEIILNEDTRIMTEKARKLQDAGLEERSLSLVNNEYDVFFISDREWVVHLKTEETLKGFYFEMGDWVKTILALITFIIYHVEHLEGSVDENGVETMKYAHSFTSSDDYDDFFNEFVSSVSSRFKGKLEKV